MSPTLTDETRSRLDHIYLSPARKNRMVKGLTSRKNHIHVSPPRKKPSTHPGLFCTLILSWVATIVAALVSMVIITWFLIILTAAGYHP